MRCRIRRRILLCFNDSYIYIYIFIYIYIYIYIYLYITQYMKNCTIEFDQGEKKIVLNHLRSTCPGKSYYYSHKLIYLVVSGSDLFTFVITLMHGRHFWQSRETPVWRIWYKLRLCFSYPLTLDPIQANSIYLYSDISALHIRTTVKYSEIMVIWWGAELKFKMVKISIVWYGTKRLLPVLYFKNYLTTFRRSPGTTLSTVR